MYSLLLGVHSWVRWVVLLACLLALYRAITGVSGGRPWTAADNKSGVWLTASLDLQMLIGLLLYGVLSPVTAEAFNDFGAAMRNPQLRFWAVEHLTGMIAAVALAHIGRVRIRRAADAAAKHRTALVFFGLALLAMVLSIPWPGLVSGRVLFRGLGL